VPKGINKAVKARQKAIKSQLNLKVIQHKVMT
jgi:hypothetical protein